ncbi:hypothetical protein A2Z67_02820 [Candidatus Woesebacteria bacterium RBG_13_36_22]|uniref:Uncharacterized protein n=1 Tax=Candidatus Woesebacteria bacterium RBG_13_36_22 TaxID=1802478 RepID=A0A1F7X5Z5_9BACT|nr:MAG: hypothetical protein A2Z67_02820 [Candidatus Woesebacteria bacterium RBG_13_36_22]
MKFKFAFILWVDAFSYDDVHPATFEFSSHPVISSGCLIKETEDEIVISRDNFPLGFDGSAPLVRGTIAIPKRMIINVTYDEKEIEILKERGNG